VLQDGWAVRFTGRVPCPGTTGGRACPFPVPSSEAEGGAVGSVIKKRRKRMAKKKHRKLLKKTRIQRRNKK
jgi:hypothetical protein